MGQGNKSLVGGGMVEEGVDTFLAGRGGGRPHPSSRENHGYLQ